MRSAFASQGRSRALFPTTRCSLLFGGRNWDKQHSVPEVFGQLYQIYWTPILSFICRQGYSSDEAQDLAQDFLLRMIDGDLLTAADPKRGRFRCLLLKSLKNFLLDVDKKRRRFKRGGDLHFVAWDDYASDPLRKTDSTEPYSAETVFDVRWAASVVEEALRRLREECEGQGHRQFFEVLSRYLDAERQDISYQRLSVALGVPETSVKGLMHEFRTRFRALLREEVGKTVETQTELEDEIRYLCSVLASVAA